MKKGKKEWHKRRATPGFEPGPVGHRGSLFWAWRENSTGCERGSNPVVTDPRTVNVPLHHTPGGMWISQDKPLANQSVVYMKCRVYRWDTSWRWCPVRAICV